MNNIYKKTITLILIINILSLPFFEITKVYAQYSVGGSYSIGGSQNIGSSGGFGDITEILRELGPAITQLPLCKDSITTNGIKGIFKKAQKVIPSNNTSTGTSIANSGKSASETFDESTLPHNIYKTKDATAGASKDEKKQSAESVEAQAIYVMDQQNLTQAEKQYVELIAQTKLQERQSENDTCLKSIGRLVAKLLIQKVTTSTAQWITGGFKDETGEFGSPTWITDLNKMYKDIENIKLLEVMNEFDDPELYPFGKRYFQNQVSRMERGVRDNLRYNMNELIERTTPEYSEKEFRNNFSKGGWNAWLALTQNDGNNVIGFTIEATNELMSRTESALIEKDKDLNRGQGFLSDERCVDPDPSITKEQDLTARKANKKIYATSFVDNNLNRIDDNTESNVIRHSAFITKDNIVYKNPIGVIGACNKWEKVTPGSVVSNAAFSILGDETRQLELIEDFNVAVATLLDAFIVYGTNELKNRGLKYYDPSDKLGSYSVGTSGSSSGGYSSQVAQDFPENLVKGDWLKYNEDFNIRTDLTQAVIDEQRIYKKKLAEENQVLSDLIKTIHQLDYCVPGPNPNWEAQTKKVLTATLNEIPSKTAGEFKNMKLDQLMEVGEAAGAIAGMAIGAAIGSSVPGLGTAIGAVVGLGVGALLQWARSKACGEYCKLSLFYNAYLITYTRINLYKGLETNDYGDDDVVITNKQDIVMPINYIYLKYKEKMKQWYKEENLPYVTAKAKIEFNKVDGYNQKIENNKHIMSVMEGVIIRLANIKDALDEMDPETNTYEQYYPYIAEFATLSETMVTGDEIGEVYSSTQEHIDRMKYIYEEMIIGEFGCEKELEDSNSSYNLPKFEDPDAQNKLEILRRLPRPLYPFPIWYDYHEKYPNGSLRYEPNEALPNLNDDELRDLRSYYNDTDTIPISERKMPDYEYKSIAFTGRNFLGPIVLSEYESSNGSKQCNYTNKLTQIDCIYIGGLFRSFTTENGKNHPKKRELIQNLSVGNFEVGLLYPY